MTRILGPGITGSLQPSLSQSGEEDSPAADSSLRAGVQVGLRGEQRWAGGAVRARAFTSS